MGCFGDLFVVVVVVDFDCVVCEEDWFCCVFGDCFG